MPKGSGKFREIYIASQRDNRRLRALLPQLENILASADVCSANYAFERGKNCALKAFQHIGYRYTLSMDLEDFFNNVTSKHVAGVIPDALIEQCFVSGNPKQGLPTSPLIATIAFLPCDRRIVELLKKLGVAAVYTRYADDLVFSFDDRRDLGKIKFIVQQTVESFGFKVHKRKTNLQDARNGRKIITGLAVDHNGIFPTRRTRRKVRAATHKGKLRSMHGLLEWSKCKLPKDV